MKDGLLKILTQFEKTFEFGTETPQERRDKIYNRIARDQPAYLSLMYPLICILIGFNFGNQKPDEEIWAYIFNILASVTLFVPALFFLYKMLIRDLSELIIEKCLFAVLGQPHRIVFRKIRKKLSFSIRLSKEETKMIFDKARDEFNLNDLNFNESSYGTFKQRTDDKLCIALDSLHDRLKGRLSVREHPIAFEYNCFYGFYRNLAGGLFLDVILTGSVLLFYKPDGQGGTQQLIPDSVMMFMQESYLWLIGLMLLIMILAFFSRIKQIKRQATIYISEKPIE